LQLGEGSGEAGVASLHLAGHAAAALGRGANDDPAPVGRIDPALDQPARLERGQQARDGLGLQALARRQFSRGQDPLAHQRSERAQFAGRRTVGFSRRAKRALQARDRAT
jgi:hypothetical protein